MSNTDKGKTKVRESGMKRVGGQGRSSGLFPHQVLGSVWREVM